MIEVEAKALPYVSAHGVYQSDWQLERDLHMSVAESAFCEQATEL